MNNLPDQLTAALQKELSKLDRGILSKAAEELSFRYRAPRKPADLFMTSEAHRLAYLAVRMPATYAVIKSVLEEIQRRIPSLNIRTISDIGAGPGTAAWAARELFGEGQISLYEQDLALIHLGQCLIGNAFPAEWHPCDLRQVDSFRDSDLSILSYVIGELPMESLPALFSKAWEASQVLVVIEPGTPHGFERIKWARQWLLDAGAFLAAPCTHQERCPMVQGDWCHFSQRLERSFLHRSIKEVSMGYEDEKYAYVAAARVPAVTGIGRILRHPQRHSGHVEFTVCTKNGLEKQVISRKQGVLYRQARKLDWGSILPT